MRYVLPFLSLLLLLGCAAEETPATPATFVEVLGGKTIDPMRVPKDGVAVLLFITNDCPIANGYSPQLHELAKSWKGLPVNFTMVHVDPELTDEAARKHAAEYSHTGQIIVDRKHQLVSAAGATITPEAAVYSASGKLEYRGRINNWYGDIGRKRAQPSKHELRDAVTALLAKQAITVTRTEAVGCNIEPLPK